MRDIFGGLEYTGWETKTVYKFQGYSESIQNRGVQEDEEALCTEMTYDVGQEARIRADLEDMVYQAFTSHSQYVAPATVADVLTKNLVISGDGMDDVKVNMALNRDTYTLTCSLTLKDSVEPNYAMTVILKASVYAPSKDLADVRNYTDENYKYDVYIWDDESLAWVFDQEEYYAITEYKINTQVTYDAGTVTKGVFH